MELKGEKVLLRELRPEDAPALYRNIEEDWGLGEPVLVDKYVFKTPR